jgi:hypothetical protein
VQELEAYLAAERRRFAVVGAVRREDLQALMESEAGLVADSEGALLLASLYLDQALALQASGSAAQSPEKFTEAEEDMELVSDLFNEINNERSGSISHAELTEALEKRGFQAERKEILQSLLSAGGTYEGAAKFSEEALSQAVEKLVLVLGELVSWARSLEEHMAWLIAGTRRGDLLDGIKGLKEPELRDCKLEDFVMSVSKEFAAVLSRVLRSGLQHLRTVGTAKIARQHQVCPGWGLCGAVCDALRIRG